MHAWAQPRRKLTGSVSREQDGGPVAGAHVVARSADGRPSRSILTNAAGDFTIFGLDEGTYTIYVDPLDQPVSPSNIGGGWTIETDFGSARAGTVSVTAGGTHDLGALFVPQIIVAAASGEPEEAIDWHAIGLADRQLEIWANICVQVLTGLFTYFNILTLPWRLSILYHMCSRRSDAPGRDFCAPAARSPPRPARCPASSDALINGRRALRPRTAQTAVRRRRFGSTSRGGGVRSSPSFCSRRRPRTLPRRPAASSIRPSPRQIRCPECSCATPPLARRSCSV